MKLKPKFPLAALVLLLTVVLFALCARPAWNLYRYIAYSLGEPTPAEQAVMAYARETGTPYGTWPQSLIDLMDRNPETREFVLSYPDRKTLSQEAFSWDADGTIPLLMQWDPRWGYETYGSSYLAITGCGPTCLSMVGLYLTGNPNLRPDQIAEFSQRSGYYSRGSGSSWTLISEGAFQLGLTAKELPLVKKKITDALESGNPVILALGPGDFTTEGHYIVLTGLEEGLFRVNDPNSYANSARLWSYEELEPQIRNIWAMGVPA